MTNNTCTFFRFSLLLVGVLFLLVSCDGAAKRLALKAQRELDQVDIMIERREFSHAQELAALAEEKLREANAQASDNVHITLLYARSVNSLFMANNAQLIEQAPLHPESLVRISAVDDYIEYDKLKESINMLERLLGGNATLTPEENASASILLAAVFRLDPSQASKALAAYNRANKALILWKVELQNSDTRAPLQKIKITGVRNQIAQIYLAMAEVNLLVKDWNAALTSLEDNMGGTDLEFFDIRLALLTEQQNTIKFRIDERFFPIIKDGRVDRLKNYIKEKRYSKISHEGADNFDSESVALLQSEVELVETKNNLLYRIICYYYNLGEQKSLIESRRILRSYDPSAEQRVIKLLQGNI